MERRSALKNMGLALGYAVATPTLVSLVQSCKEKAAYASWVPTFFEKDEGYVLAQLVDIILPKTDTPSATELNVHIFIDELAAKLMKTQEETIQNTKSEWVALDGGKIKSKNKDFLKMTMGKFTDAALEASGKDELSDLNFEDFEPLLAKHLKKMSDEAEEAHDKTLDAYAAAVLSGETAELDAEVACVEFAHSIRGLATWGYKSSEYIAEEVLAYMPVPGEYIACGDVDELTQGKAWSLE